MARAKQLENQFDNRSATRVASNLWRSQESNYWLFACTVAAQLATVIITWQLWQVRVDPPNLPLFELPQFSFGIWIVISLVYMLIDPRRGFLIHVTIMVVASVFDQFRMQPQFLAIIFLMFATISQNGRVVCRWFLAALWLWAGIHKLVSPHWFAHAGHWMLQSLSFDNATADRHLWVFAFSIAFAEIVTGITAILRPKWASILCMTMHVSIFVLLIIIKWNYSVLPWNLATAVVGTWVMWTTGSEPLADENVRRKRKWLSLTAATIFLVFPAGFYLGWVDHGYASVLYSDNVPRGLMTGKTALREISGWAPVHVPFPYERRTHLQFFESIGKPGDKLHIFDPRPMLADQYFQKVGVHANQISAAQFYDTNGTSVAGIGIDDRYAKFWLRRWGKITQRWYANPVSESDTAKYRDNLVSFAYTFDPNYYGPEALELLAGLPNLEQLQLAGCEVHDDDLKLVANLKRLTAIGLKNTAVTDAGLRHLHSLTRLKRLEVEGTQISPKGLERLQQQLGY